jgi:2-amino-4-hydroxy-6-hydroxymethyldihydropteridine diphosphokinase
MSDGIYLALGSNLGNRAANIALAMRTMAPLVRVEAVSSLYESPPQDGSEQPLYYNAACRIVTGLSPELLLAHVKRVERLTGRRSAAHWAPRVIDIDVALYGERVIQSPALSVPHPRLTERPFVLRPLLDLDPGLVLPGTQHPLSSLRAASEDITLVAAGEWWRSPRAVGVPEPSAQPASS